MKKRSYEIAQDWNKMIKALLIARKRWEELGKLKSELEQTALEDLPLQIQKVLGIFGRQRFDVMLPRLIQHWGYSGGLDDLLVDLKRIDREEENEGIDLTQKEVVVNG